MKNPRSKRDRRELFVLIPEEKRTIGFVLVALLLGIGAKHYRGSHSVPLVRTAIVETAKSAGLPAQKRAEAKRRKLTK